MIVSVLHSFNTLFRVGMFLVVVSGLTNFDVVLIITTILAVPVHMDWQATIRKPINDNFQCLYLWLDLCQGQVLTN